MANRVKQLRHLIKRVQSIAGRARSRANRPLRRIVRMVSNFSRRSLGVGRAIKLAAQTQRLAAKRVKGLRKRWWRFTETFPKTLSRLFYKKLHGAAAVKYLRQLDRRATKQRKILRKRRWQFQASLGEGRRWLARRFWRLFAYFFIVVLGMKPVVRSTRRLRTRYGTFKRWRRAAPVRRWWKIWVREPIHRRISHVQYHYHAEIRGIHLKEQGRSYEKSYKGPWGKLRYQRTVTVGNRKKRRMFQAYTRVSSTVPMDVPFVYVPLHFQPERTTSSLGGVFADQYLLVDLIARSLPEGWKVYVKEHPSQFYPPFAGERSRHQDLYRDLAAIPRVHLVSLSVSTFELIDSSRAVATVTGTAGWEAVLRGRPALVVGSPWYRYCDGVFVVSTESALRAALLKVQDGYAPDPRKVRLFVKVLTELCARAGLGYNTPDELELGLNLIQHVERVVAVTERYWDRMQVEPPPSLFLAGTPPLLAATRAPDAVFGHGEPIGGLHPVRVMATAVANTTPATADAHQ